jgi:hypothetical protein
VCAQVLERAACIGQQTWSLSLRRKPEAHAGRIEQAVVFVERGQRIRPPRESRAVLQRGRRQAQRTGQRRDLLDRGAEQCPTDGVDRRFTADRRGRLEARRVRRQELNTGRHCR